MMKHNRLKEILTEMVREEYRGFKKNQNFKLTDKEVDPETGTITTSVKYLPRFNEIRRALTNYGVKVKTLENHGDNVISEYAINAVKQLRAANSYTAEFEIGRAHV